MDVVKIALASSMKEFEQERDKLEERIEVLFELLVKQKIYINFELWRKSVKWDEKGQEEFNRRIRESDFFFAIIGKAVGKYTRQEIDVAARQFRYSGCVQPRIKAFFQDLPTDDPFPAGKEPPYMLKSWAIEMGYCVLFSKFEKLYGTIIAELVKNGAIFQEWKKKCNTPLKARWTIRANRKKSKSSLKQVLRKNLKQNCCFFTRKIWCCRKSGIWIG